MQTKVCSRCCRELPLTEFHSDKKGKFGVKSACKACTHEYYRKYYLTHPCRAKKEEKDLLGGYKIYILDYVKKNERKYNVARTDGSVFKTNNKREFLNFLEGI
jgi:hypothetical protein